MNNIIYGLYCPITKSLVYIGKSTKGLDRPFEHIEERSHSKKVNEWVSYLKSEALSPTVVVLEYTDNPSILDVKEKFWVQLKINEGCILLNQQLISPLFFKTNQYSIESKNPLIGVSTYIKIKRKQLKLTQKDLAIKAGVGLRFIRELEQGNKTNFNTDGVLKILRLFGGKLTVS